LRAEIVRNPGLSLPLGLAALAWLVLAGLWQAEGSLALCLSGAGGVSAQLREALAAQWALLDGAALAGTWAVMCLAMMLPIATSHLSVATAKSLPRARWPVLGGALLGYLAVWLALGLPYAGLFLGASALHGLVGAPLVAGLVYGLAILWSICPARARLLRRCHPVPAFFGGRAAQSSGAARWGGALGLRCAGVCFPAMAAPMLTGQGLLGMVLVTHVLLVERRAAIPSARLSAYPLAVLGFGALVVGALGGV
jgi:predicted metal-binding membrane protein